LAKTLSVQPTKAYARLGELQYNQTHPAST
jgi:hypothetical protein